MATPQSDPKRSWTAVRDDEETDRLFAAPEAKTSDPGAKTLDSLLDIKPYTKLPLREGQLDLFVLLPAPTT